MNQESLQLACKEEIAYQSMELQERLLIARIRQIKEDVGIWVTFNKHQHCLSDGNDYTRTNDVPRTLFC